MERLETLAGLSQEDAREVLLHKVDEELTHEKACLLYTSLEDLCEPYLMQMGFLTRTPRGRCATRLAYEHLGLKAPETGSPEDNGQQSLF